MCKANNVMPAVSVTIQWTLLQRLRLHGAGGSEWFQAESGSTVTRRNSNLRQFMNFGTRRNSHLVETLLVRNSNLGISEFRHYEEA